MDKFLNFLILVNFGQSQLDISLENSPLSELLQLSVSMHLLIDLELSLELSDQPDGQIGILGHIDHNDSPVTLDQFY